MSAPVFTSLSDPRLVDMILAGAIGILPTDTVYGLVAKADSPSALARFFAAKQRHGEPGTLIGASSQQFEDLGFSPKLLERAKSYWPNPISIVLNATTVDHSIKQHRLTLPLRVPFPPELRQLLAVTGVLMTTSANQPGLLTATTITEAIEYFGQSVDFYVDTGVISNPPSTIIEITPGHSVIVHRQGAVPLN